MSAGPLTRFPDASNDFEYTGVTAANPIVANPPWVSPWVFTGSAGIAHQSSAWVTPLPPPGNRRVAYVQGTGKIGTACTVGLWRLRFQATQRQDGGSNQVLQVFVGTTEVFDASLPGGSFAEYKTRPFRVVTPQQVEFRGTGAADDVALLDLPVLEPVADWALPASWSPAQVPGPTNAVVIPDGVEVALTGAASAASVTVNGELLTDAVNATLDTNFVTVSGIHARFEVGQELTPFLQSFTLTLLGNTDTADSALAGSKFLMAMDGGTIDMHGSHRKSWTKLAALAATGSEPSTEMSLTVDDRNGWSVGDEIVLAYTGHVADLAGWGTACSAPHAAPYRGPRSQRRTITAIGPGIGQLTVAGSLDPADHGTWQPQHYQGPNHPAGWDLDQRAEVGMLTRNVRIVGSPTTNGFGGHVMIMACCNAMPVGLGRFANVELSNMGQRQALGRYPIHWHMVRNERPGQYLRNSSIHDNHNRAITIHGSHNILVEDNVCCDTMGHAVFLEDGVEENNQFVHNLVLVTRKPGQCQHMLPHDNSSEQAQNRSPASFWISNPNNHFVGNVAADSMGTGYWFVIHERSTGLSATPAWIGFFTSHQGTHTDLGSFDDNAAHSLKMGVDLHDSIADGAGSVFPQAPCTGAFVTCSLPSPTKTRTNPLDDGIATNVQWLPPNEALLRRFTAYGCTTGIYSGGGVQYSTKVRFDDCVLADNGVHVQVASAETVTNSLFVHDTGHSIFPTGAPYLVPYESGNAYVVYDGPGRIFDSHFVGYTGLTQGGNLVFTEFGAARRHTNHEFRGLSFPPGELARVGFPDINLATGVFADSQVWGVAIRDLDGSLTGGVIPANPLSPFPTPQPHTLVTNHPMMHLTSASGTPDLPLPTNAWLSPFRWGHLQVRYYSATGSHGPNTQYVIQGDNNLPATAFVRQPHLGWNSASFLSDYLLQQMRQLPVIIRPAAYPAMAECVYEVVLYVNAPGPAQPARVDFSLDDVAQNDVARFIITNALSPGWSPALVVNDDPAKIHLDGAHPYGLPAVPHGPPAGHSTYQLTTDGVTNFIDLRMVNTGRTHRITITW